MTNFDSGVQFSVMTPVGGGVVTVTQLTTVTTTLAADTPAAVLPSTEVVTQALPSTTFAIVNSTIADSATASTQVNVPAATQAASQVASQVAPPAAPSPASGKSRIFLSRRTSIN